MSKQNGRDYIYLIWKDPNTGQNYTVGQLSKNQRYEFSYGHDVNEATKEGFKLLIAFENIHKVYQSDTLFPTFSSRLPDKKRRDIKKILSKYGLQQYDEFELLKRSGTRLPIDTLQFIDPILEDDQDLARTFHVAGVRHHFGCEGQHCNDALNLDVGNKLKLVPEPTNQYDRDAVKIIDSKGNRIGYVPRYYSESVTNLLKKEGIRYNCTVLEVKKDNDCQVCVKVKLEFYTDANEIKK